ncbi:MAG: hypothetical protein HY533_06115 [Chloroflexi bacterium]|nr:hypothetical protein [Chloroflexota bacterium]
MRVRRGVALSALLVGAVGAVAATAAERYRPRVASVWDDNLNVGAMSLAVMGVLAKSSV